MEQGSNRLNIALGFIELLKGEQNNKSFQIFVKILEGKSIAIEIDKETTIDTILEKVSQKTGDALSDIRLLFGGKQLSNGTAADYDLQSESTLIKTSRMLGGAVLTKKGSFLRSKEEFTSFYDDEMSDDEMSDEEIKLQEELLIAFQKANIKMTYKPSFLMKYISEVFKSFYGQLADLNGAIVDFDILREEAAKKKELLVNYILEDINKDNKFDEEYWSNYQLIVYDATEEILKNKAIFVDVEIFSNRMAKLSSKSSQFSKDLSIDSNQLNKKEEERFLSSLIGNKEIGQDYEISIHDEDKEELFKLINNSTPKRNEFLKACNHLAIFYNELTARVTKDVGSVFLEIDVDHKQFTLNQKVIIAGKIKEHIKSHKEDCKKVLYAIENVVSSFQASITKETIDQQNKNAAGGFFSTLGAFLFNTTVNVVKTNIALKDLNSAFEKEDTEIEVNPAMGIAQYHGNGSVSFSGAFFESINNVTHELAKLGAISIIGGYVSTAFLDISKTFLAYTSWQEPVSALQGSARYMLDLIQRKRKEIVNELDNNYSSFEKTVDGWITQLNTNEGRFLESMKVLGQYRSNLNDIEKEIFELEKKRNEKSNEDGNRLLELQSNKETLIQAIKLLEGKKEETKENEKLGLDDFVKKEEKDELEELLGDYTMEKINAKRNAFLKNKEKGSVSKEKEIDLDKLGDNDSQKTIQSIMGAAAKIIDVKADGTCLFRALGYAVDENQLTGDKIREKLVAFFKKVKEALEKLAPKKELQYECFDKETRHSPWLKNYMEKDVPLFFPKSYVGAYKLDLMINAIEAGAFESPIGDFFAEMTGTILGLTLNVVQTGGGILNVSKGKNGNVLLYLDNKAKHFQYLKGSISVKFGESKLNVLEKMEEVDQNKKATRLKKLNEKLDILKTASEKLSWDNDKFEIKIKEAKEAINVEKSILSIEEYAEKKSEVNAIENKLSALNFSIVSKIRNYDKSHSFLYELWKKEMEGKEIPTVITEALAEYSYEMVDSDSEEVEENIGSKGDIELEGEFFQNIETDEEKWTKNKKEIREMLNEIVKVIKSNERNKNIIKKIKEYKNKISLISKAGYEELKGWYDIQKYCIKIVDFLNLGLIQLNNLEDDDGGILDFFKKFDLKPEEEIQNSVGEEIISALEKLKEEIPRLIEIKRIRKGLRSNKL